MSDQLTNTHAAMAASLGALREAGAYAHLLAIPVEDATLRGCMAEAREGFGVGRPLDAAWWHSRILPVLFGAADWAYRYPGSGYAYWGGLEERLGHPLDEANRYALADHFRRVCTDVTPTQSRWERAYSRIAWPVAHAVLPRMLHLPFSIALKRMITLNGVPPADAPPQAVGELLVRETHPDDSSLLTAILADTTRGGELALALLHRDRASDLFRPRFLETLGSDLDRVSEIRSALRQARASRDDERDEAPGPELLLNWERMQLLVDLTTTLARHREELASRGYDQIDWVGGRTWLGQLAQVPQELRDLPVDEDQVPLFPAPPAGLSAELRRTLSELSLDLSTPLVFAAGEDPTSTGVQSGGPHRVLVRDATTAPARGEQLYPVAGLACFQYDGPPDRNPGSVNTEVRRRHQALLAPPDLRTRRPAGQRSLLESDVVVERRDSADGPVLQVAPQARLGQRVQRHRARPWTAFAAKVSPPNTVALRTRRSSLYLDGPAGIANSPLNLTLRRLDRQVVASVTSQLTTMPAVLRPQDGPMKRLASAAHRCDPEEPLSLEVTMGGGAPIVVPIAGVVRTAWREDGVLRTEVDEAADIERRSGRLPLATDETTVPGLFLEHLVIDGRPLLSSGAVTGPSEFIRGTAAPQGRGSVTRTPQPWGGAFGVQTVLDSYLAWSSAIPGGDSPVHAHIVAMAQRELCDWLDEQLTRALCGERWLEREREAVRHVRLDFSTRWAHSLVMLLANNNDPALEALVVRGWHTDRVVELVRAAVVVCGGPPTDEESAEQISERVTEALDEALKAQGLFDPSALYADVWLGEQDLQSIDRNARPEGVITRLAALVRPPELRDVLRQPRRWGWMTTDSVLELLSGLDAPGAVIRTLLLVWTDPDALAMDALEHRDEALSAALDDRDVARAVRWVALALRGDLDGTG